VRNKKCDMSLLVSLLLVIFFTVPATIERTSFKPLNRGYCDKGQNKGHIGVTGEEHVNMVIVSHFKPCTCLRGVQWFKTSNCISRM